MELTTDLTIDLVSKKNVLRFIKSSTELRAMLKVKLLSAWKVRKLCITTPAPASSKSIYGSHTTPTSFDVL